jgi:hypothetical protein
MEAVAPQPYPVSDLFQILTPQEAKGTYDIERDVNPPESFGKRSRCDVRIHFGGISGVLLAFQKWRERVEALKISNILSRLGDLVDSSLLHAAAFIGGRNHGIPSDSPLNGGAIKAEVVFLSCNGLFCEVKILIAKCLQMLAAIKFMRLHLHGPTRRGFRLIGLHRERDKEKGGAYDLESLRSGPFLWSGSFRGVFHSSSVLLHQVCRKHMTVIGMTAPSFVAILSGLEETP